MNRLNRRTAFSLVELTAASAMTVLLVSVALPALQQSREDARLTACKNNLKQIGLALHNYHDVFRTFPPGWVQKNWDAPSPAGHGWLTFVLPYIDHAPTYNLVDFNAPPVPGVRPYDVVIAAYHCPADTTELVNPLRGGFPTANYSGNFGRTPLPRWLPAEMSDAWPGTVPTPDKSDGLYWCNSKVRIADITDGTSNTFLVGERCVTSGAGIWPGVTGNQNENDLVTDCSHGSWLNTGYSAYSSLHTGGANFLMCDGRVVFVADTIDSAPASAERTGMYQRLADRDDRQPVKF
jgi:prepilin-type processing-associated H-X9-DG protein